MSASIGSPPAPGGSSGAERPEPPAVDDRSDDQAPPQIDVGVLVAHSPGGDAGVLEPFAGRMARDGVGRFAGRTGPHWGRFGVRRRCRIEGASVSGCYSGYAPLGVD